MRTGFFVWIYVVNEKEGDELDYVVRLVSWEKKHHTSGLYPQENTASSGLLLCEETQCVADLLRVTYFSF